MSEKSININVEEAVVETNSNEAEVGFDFSTEIVPEAELNEVYNVEKEFVKSYINSVKEKIPVEEWLPAELQKQLPERTALEIQQMSAEIIDTLKVTEEMKKSQQEAIAQGRSRESWLGKKLTESTSHMSAEKSAEYLRGLDEAIDKVNEETRKTILTKSGAVNQNPHLDGLIAEQQHANSFNLNAKANGGENYAEVLRSNGKDSVDVVIKNKNGQVVQKYQMKYCDTAEATVKAIKGGNYKDQTIVVPEEQLEYVKSKLPGYKIVSSISDGKTSSNTLSKEEIKEMQEKAQKGGSFLEKDWSSYSTKDIAFGIGKQTAVAGLQGVAIGAGMDIITKLWNDEEIDGKEVVETALKSGADFGVKTAVAGAIKTASEKGVLAVIPKGTPASTFTSIAFVGVECAKTFAKVATGEMTVNEGIGAVQETAGACVAGIVASTAAGKAVGAALGTVFGPVGTAIGGFVGSTVGYIAGSKIGQAVVKGAKKIGSAVVNAVKKAASGVKEGIKALGRGILSLLGF